MQASPLLPASPEKGTPFYPPPDMVVWAYDCATCFASVTPRVQITKRLLSGNEKHQHHRNNEILLLIADIFKVNKCIFFFFFFYLARLRRVQFMTAPLHHGASASSYTRLKVPQRFRLYRKRHHTVLDML